MEENPCMWFWTFLKDIVCVQRDDNDVRDHATLVLIVFTVALSLFTSRSEVWVQKKYVWWRPASKHGNLQAEVSDFWSHWNQWFYCEQCLLPSQIGSHVLLCKIHIDFNSLPDWYTFTPTNEMKEANFRPRFCSVAKIGHNWTLIHWLEWSKDHYTFPPFWFYPDPAQPFGKRFSNLVFFELFNSLGSICFSHTTTIVVAAVVQFEIWWRSFQSM